jgi:Holliday junction resolvase-like predicted endonuclease
MLAALHKARARIARWLKDLGIRTRPLTPTERLGQRGERAAVSHLRRKGYAILGRNLRVPMGEADIVCRAPDERTIVLIEVKARIVADDRSPRQRSTESAIDERKRATLRQILRHLSTHNRWARHARRIDVIAIDFDEHDRVRELRHHESAVAYK